MADELVGSARVRIEPDLSGFEPALLSELRSALDSAADAITGSFRDASTQAAESLGGIGQGGFDPVASAADAAAVAIGVSFASAAEQVTSDLSGAGEGAGQAIVSEFDSAASGVVSAMSGAASEADHALSGIGEGIQVDIPVSLDTGDAEQQAEGLGEELSSLGSSANGATEGVENLTTSTGGLSEAVNLGSGSLQGLQGLLGGISPEAKLATGALGGVATVLGVLTTSGTKSIESQERFNRTFGEFAKQITDVDVGTLNGDLGDLAKTLGSGTGGLRDAATAIGQIGAASGKSAPEVAETAEQVLALSLQVRALRPELGDAGTIAEGLTTALSRGGRAAFRYGINLTSAEIAAHGVEMGLANTSDELTQFDKLMAGADLTAQRLGDSLGKNVASGADNLSIRWDRLSLSFRSVITEMGKETAIPVLELLEELAPAGLNATRAIGGVAQGLLPLFQGLGAVAGLIEKVPDELITFALTLGVLTKAAPIVGGGLGFVADALFSVASRAIDATGGLTDFAQASTDASNTAASGFLAGLNPAVLGATVALTAYGAVQGESAKHSAEVARLTAEATAAFTDQTGQVRISTAALTEFTKAQGNESLQKGLESTGKSYKDVTDAILSGKSARSDLLKDLDDVNDTAILSVETFRRAFTIGSDKRSEAGNAFRDLADSIDAAAREAIIGAGATGALSESEVTAALAADDVLGAYNRLQPKIEQHERLVATLTAKYGPFVDAITVAGGALDALEGSSPGVVKSITDLADGIGDTRVDLVNLANGLDAAKLSEEDMAIAATLLGTDVDSLQGFIDGTTQALDDFVNAAVGALPTVGDAFKKMGDDIEGTKIDESKILSPKEFINNLNTATEGMRTFLGDLEQLRTAGFTALAGEIAKQGPEIGGSLATGLTTALDSGNRLLVENANKALTDFNSQWKLNTDYLRSTLGPEFIIQTGLVASLASKAFGEDLDFATGLKIATGLAASTMDSEGKAVAAIAASEGALAAEQYGSAVLGMEQGAIDAAVAAGLALVAQEPSAADAGWGVGAAVVDGMNEGVKARMKVLIASLQKAGRDMISTVKVVIDAQSPSREFIKIGHMVTDGLAIGIDQGADDVVAAAEAITRAAAAAAWQATAPSMQDLWEKIAALEGTTAEDVRLGGGGNATTESLALRGQLEAMSGLGDVVRLGDVTEAVWNQLLDAGWLGDPTDHMEALHRPSDAGAFNRPGTFTVQSMPIHVSVTGDVSDERAREVGWQVGTAAHQRMLALVDREVTAETRLAGL